MELLAVAVERLISSSNHPVFTAVFSGFRPPAFSFLFQHPLQDGEAGFHAILNGGGMTLSFEGHLPQV